MSAVATATAVTSARRTPLRTRLRRTPEALRGAVVLVACTVAALVWANVPGGTYEAFWHLPLGIDAGPFRFELDLKHWVNDLLMAVFFAHVTLEVRRELELGDLRDWRKASVPVTAAVAGLVVPALLYVALTRGTDAVGGWGVVVSTDTAFVLGMLALVGRGLPPQLRAFLVTLVVADDVGALAVVAFAYTDDFDPLPLLLAAAGLVAIAVMRWLGVWRGPLYLLPAAVVWLGFFLSGVHATLAGVAIALLLPIFRTRTDDLRRAQDHVRAFQMVPTAGYARTAEDSLARAVSMNERAHRALDPYVTWAILPIFALANAGVRMTPETLADAFTSRLTLGIVVGLVVGKVVAISLATWVMTRLRPDALGPGLRMSHVVGMSMLAGMGFTISLFVAELAFADPADVGRAQIGVLAATVLAAVLGGVTFLVIDARERRRSPHRGRLVRPLDASRDHLLGDPSRALVRVVEYGGHGTPHLPTSAEMRRLMAERFGDRVVFAFRYLPRDEPLGHDVARANEAAARQGRFWEMRDELLREAPVTTERQVLRAAAAAGVNLRRFEADWRDTSVAARVEEDVADAEAMHLEQAPTYFVEDVRHDAAIDAESVLSAIGAAVAAVEARGPRART